VKPSQSFTFDLRGQVGRVGVGYEVNEDPARWGFDLLGLTFDTDVARGFPVIEARVEYRAEGYGGYLGWVQVVRYSVRHGSEQSATVVVDVPPQMREAPIPYLSFGIEPVLFDAPAFTERDVTWKARSFLTASPDALMSPFIEPVCGFSWGYNITDGHVEPTSLRACDRDDWSEARRSLQERLPDWTFGGDDWKPLPFDATTPASA
jgi:hypothetical protein